MSKRTRQYLGVLFAIVAYYIVHEGAHLIMALYFHAFKKIHFMWLGIQVDVYRDRLTDGCRLSAGWFKRQDLSAGKQIVESCFDDRGSNLLPGTDPDVIYQ